MGAMAGVYIGGGIMILFALGVLLWDQKSRSKKDRLITKDRG